MPSEKISEMPALATLQNVDLIPVVQTFVNYTVTRPVLLTATSGEPIALEGNGAIIQIDDAGNITLQITAGNLFDITDTTVNYFSIDDTGAVVITAVDNTFVNIVAPAGGTVNITGFHSQLTIDAAGAVELDVRGTETFLLVHGTVTIFEIGVHGEVNIFCAESHYTTIGVVSVSFIEIFTPGAGQHGDIAIGVDAGGTIEISYDSTTVFGVDDHGSVSIDIPNTETFTITANGSMLEIDDDGKFSFNDDFIISSSVSVLHLGGNGGTPTVTTAGGLGTGGTYSIAGTDTAGKLHIHVGSSPGTGKILKVNFANAYGAAPYVVFSPASTGAAGIALLAAVYVVSATDGFELWSRASLPVGTDADWYWHCIGNFVTVV